jgi:hypothetical protein
MSQAGVACDQDQLPSPLAGEYVDGFDGGARAACGGFLEQHTLAVALGHDDEAGAAIGAFYRGQCG